MSRLRLDKITKTHDAPIRRTISLTVEQWLYVIHTLQTYKGGCCEEYFSECHDPEEMVVTEHRKANSLIGQIIEHLIEEDYKNDGGI